MEISSHPLAIESFSNSWLESRKHIFEAPSEPLRPSLDFSSETKPEETKHTIMVKPNGPLEEGHSFNFDIPSFKNPPFFVHADEIFSHGHILPIYGDPSSGNALTFSSSAISPPFSSISLRKSLKKFSKKALQKYLGYFCRRDGSSRRRRKVEDIRGRTRRVKSLENSPSPDMVYFSRNLRDSESKENTVSFSENWRFSEREGTEKNDGILKGQRRVMSCGNSPLASPLRSPSLYSAGHWGVDDSSIYEAILYCKSSFGKPQGT
ncbi:hypothetical protein NMG60_11028977 [Bertholletia excelsa]